MQAAAGRLLRQSRLGHPRRVCRPPLQVRAETTDVFGEGKGGMEVIQEIAAKVQQQVRNIPSPPRRVGCGCSRCSCWCWSRALLGRAIQHSQPMETTTQSRPSRTVAWWPHGLVCVCVLQAVPWDEVYNEIAAREMALLDALVGGKGLEEHMETFYLASLQQAVTRSAVSVVADAAASASASAGAQGQQQKV